MFNLAHVLSDIIKGEGFMSYPAVYHEGRLNCFGFTVTNFASMCYNFLTKVTSTSKQISGGFL